MPSEEIQSNEPSLCRICLEDGASHPIFGPDSDQDSVSYKLSLCLNEKIEDIEGYPKNICSICMVALETVCSFINKYKDSCKILESGVLIVKDENYAEEYSDNDLCHSEVDIGLEQIKHEPIDVEETEDNECIADLLKPLCSKPSKDVKTEIEKISKNKNITIKKIKPETKNKTNKVASALLEGEFDWTGDKWCLRTVKLKKNKQRKPGREVKRSREVKLEIPKIKKSKTNPTKLCDLCGEVFKNQEKLSIHKKKVHYKNPANCPHCPQICTSPYYLNRHIKRKHEKSKNFICATCGKGFAFKGELSTHNRSVHDKHLHPKKVFSCKFCDKTYKCAKSIIVHERSAHTGHRPAECDICGSSFYHIDYLKEHMRLHTGETPFKCPICGRGYAQRCNMKSHLRIHRLAEIDDATLSKIKPNYLKLLKDFR